MARGFTTEGGTLATNFLAIEFSRVGQRNREKEKKREKRGRTYSQCLQIVQSFLLMRNWLYRACALRGDTQASSYLIKKVHIPTL